MRQRLKLLGAVSAALVAGMLTEPPALAAPASLAPPEAAVGGAAGLTADVAKLDPDPGRALAKFWTPQRMAAALAADRLAGSDTATAMPASLPPARIGGSDPLVKPAPGKAGGLHQVTGERWPNRYDTPAYSNGKVFFTQGGLGYACSGAVINSEAKTTVFTAGHCVHGGKGGVYHSNWYFVPNYFDNDKPVGTWYAKQLWTLNGWSNDSNNSFDIGAAVMWTNSANQRIADVTGSQGIEWNSSRGQSVYHWAYPANSPFNGESLQYCTGTTVDSGSDLSLTCNMQGGASGGIWVRGYNGTWGYAISINSYHKGTDLTRIYGPYFGDGAANLYNAVRNLS